VRVLAARAPPLCAGGSALSRDLLPRARLPVLFPLVISSPPAYLLLPARALAPPAIVLCDFASLPVPRLPRRPAQVLVNGYLSVDKFRIDVETMHVPDDAGALENACHLSAEELKERKVRGWKHRGRRKGRKEGVVAGADGSAGRRTAQSAPASVGTRASGASLLLCACACAGAPRRLDTAPSAAAAPRLLLLLSLLPRFAPSSVYYYLCPLVWLLALSTAARAPSSGS